VHTFHTKQNTKFMAKVCNAPSHIVKPVFDWYNFEASKKAEDDYVQQVRNYARLNGKGELAGEQLDIQYADGYARYVVFSLSPVTLIHLAVGDEWDAPIAHHMTARAIKATIDFDRSMVSNFKSLSHD
jgi:hypothetical protein